MCEEPNMVAVDSAIRRVARLVQRRNDVVPNRIGKSINNNSYTIFFIF